VHDQDELPAEERVEGVGHPERLLLKHPTSCN
jgi:hypothetical protein